MTNEAKLPKTQAAALELLGSDEVEFVEWKYGRGANGNAIDALTRKGLVTVECRMFFDPKYLGVGGERNGRFYRAA